MNTSVKIGKITLKNPVMVASGTFGIGEEYAEFIDINKIGAIITKTITLKPKIGNPPPRLVETPAGMLNAIGLENKGCDDFIKNKSPFLQKLKTRVIVSIGGETTNEFVELAKRLNDLDIDGVELNISCPNIKNVMRHASCAMRKNNNAQERSKAKPPRRGRTAHNAKLIAHDPKTTYEVVRSVRKVTKKTLITKLSPNVTDITEIAKAAEDAGSDAVSLVNTFIGMAVDIDSRRPKLGAMTGGLSGPAIKPIALRMVWEVFNKVKIPIIGIGGIMDYKDAIEFIICGATAIQVGTANFINPKVTIEIIKGIEKYLRKNRLKSIKNLVGILKL